MKEKNLLNGYAYAKEVYGEQGIDIDAAIESVDKVPISMHCWQGDDFHGTDLQALSGGIAVTGNHFGCARNCDELRDDFKEALKLIPGKVKLNLHSNYAEAEGKIPDRDAITISNFSRWIDFAKDNHLGLDFNPTFLKHPNMDGNFTLASNDASIRNFWIEHGKRCREIGQGFGEATGEMCIVNYWMPDGFKDVPADTSRYRANMLRSLDEIFAKPMNQKLMRESIESKLFGFGIESYTVASHEFSLGYAITRQKIYCIDFGHFHPTESIADKISAILPYAPDILLHISRGVRWDSDHVPVYCDELERVMREIVTGKHLNNTFIAQDYFDGSINRLACWVIAMRNTRRALLKAMLDPIPKFVEAEEKGDFSKRLALLEESKALPYSAVWDYYCYKQGVPVGIDWYEKVETYEKNVLFKR